MDHNQLQEDLAAVSTWCNQWNLTLNSNKCVAIHFSSQPQQTVPYNIGEAYVPFLDTQRDLGVTVSGTLSWSCQCDLVCTKAYRSLHVIRRNVPLSSPVYLKRQLYLTLVKSHASFCCQLWSHFLIKDIQSIEKIQRRATKYIYTSDYKSRLLSLNMLYTTYVLAGFARPMFLVKCLKDPHDTIHIYQYVNFVTTTEQEPALQTNSNTNLQDCLPQDNSILIKLFAFGMHCPKIY